MVKVLIADDAAFMRAALTHIAKSAGHTVVATASTGEEAVSLFKEHAPELVTLDLLMPGEGGMWALEQIMKLNPDTKVIMVTAIGLETKEEQAREAGASGYIRKPFRPDIVIDEIDRVLGEGAR